MLTKLTTRIGIIVIAISLSTNACSQTWSPPGAEWHYTETGAWWDGYSKYTYSRDTVINSVNCKEITRYYEGMGWNGYSQGYNNPYFTYEQNGIVYIYNNIYGNDRFDTLYNINAQIGARWRFPLVDTACADSSYFIEVLNTGTKVVNGFNLKWWYVQIGPVEYYDNSFFYSHDTIIERFGYRVDNIAGSSYAYCNNTSYEGTGGNLRCYSDSTFGFYSTEIASSCDYYYTSVLELQGNERMLKIYPNPATDKLNVAIDVKQSETAIIEILDITGKLHISCVLNKNNSVTEISIADLSAGIYMYKLIVNNNIVKLGKLSVIS